MTPDQLLPQVYDELRKLAAAKLAAEEPGHTLDATALVHEVWLKLGAERSFASKSDYLMAAAQAMRRVLVDHARNRRRLKRGGDKLRLELIDQPASLAEDLDLVLSLDELLHRLEADDPAAANVARLHLFGGLSVEDAATISQQSRAVAYRNWKFARAWLREQLEK